MSDSRAVRGNTMKKIILLCLFLTFGKASAATSTVCVYGQTSNWLTDPVGGYDAIQYYSPTISASGLHGYQWTNAGNWNNGYFKNQRRNR